MKTCIICKQPIIHHNNLQIDYPVTMKDITTKGMIYSSNGYNEYKISQMCEVCYDETCLNKNDLFNYRKNYTENY